jgi:tellurite resistance protein TehA-like permease
LDASGRAFKADLCQFKKTMNKTKRQFEWAISFWIGVALMCLINVWKITENQHAISYSWIMFGISIIFIIICLIEIAIKGKKQI